MHRYFLMRFNELFRLASKNWVIIGSDIGRQTVTWTNAEILSIEPQGTSINDIFINATTFASSAVNSPFCPGL